MADSQIAERIQAIIVDKLGVEASEVTPEASFAGDLGADSLDTVELIMEFEKEFGISIPDDKAETISTVACSPGCKRHHCQKQNKYYLFHTLSFQFQK